VEVDGLGAAMSRVRFLALAAQRSALVLRARIDGCGGGGGSVAASAMAD
jgi:hypothetical protein